VPLSDDSVKRTTSFFDVRKYAHIWYRNSLAFRLVGATSFGADPRQFTVGGPGTLRGYDVYDFETQVPGTMYDNLLGRNLMVMNLEYRFPLVDYLIFGWPGRFGFSGIGATVFFDAGSAFNQDFDKFQVFTTDITGNTRLADLNADFGFGIRTNLGGLPLKFDWGWKTDLVNVGNAQFNFSIGPEF
jgi:outer membrane protein assembly factor BamA